jgi:hypothetical protein
MVVQFLNLHFPSYFDFARSVIDTDRQVAPIVKLPQQTIADKISPNLFCAINKLRAHSQGVKEWTETNLEGSSTGGALHGALREFTGTDTCTRDREHFDRFAERLRLCRRRLKLRQLRRHAPAQLVQGGRRKGSARTHWSSRKITRPGGSSADQALCANGSAART